MKPNAAVACLGAIALALLWSAVVWAQQGETDPAKLPPQILTTDLAQRTQAPSEEMTVSFVIVDSDTVTAVTINGEPQDIEPGDTVMVSKTFRFDQDRTLIVVQATDEQGNSATRSYVVLRPGFDPGAPRYFAAGELRYELDDNPSNDLSTPVSLKGVDVTGVVPDSEQKDYRTTVKASGGVFAGPWSAYAGADLIRYGKSENRNLESDVLYVGGGYDFGRPFVKYLFADINVGAYDYAQQHTITPGYDIESADAEGSRRHRFALDLTLKNFASSGQEDATLYTARWEYFSLDPQRQDSFRSVVGLGNSSEGIDATDYKFVAGNFDWKNQWDSGLLFDIGFGAEYRRFDSDVPLSKDTPLGDKRVDNLWRVSFAPGYKFSQSIRALFNYRYVVNVSNKAPYVRQVYGLVLQGVY